MTSLRHVHRVTLRAPSEALVRRGALLLEDALRTASWAADVPGRLVVVRRLDVGAIDPDESPAALAIRVEERLRVLGARLVHAGAPGALHAEAVFFRDRIEAALLLAEHAAQSSAKAPWFLARAVPSYRPGAGSEHALRCALAAALEVSPQGPIALVEMLAARAAAQPLLAALRERDGALLLRALGVDAHAAARALDAATVNDVDDRAPTPSARAAQPSSTANTSTDTRPLPPPEPAVAQRAPSLPSLDHAPIAGALPIAPTFVAQLAAHVPTWGASDARSIWLAAAALLARAPSLHDDPRLGAKAAALAATFARASHAPLPEPARAAAPARLFLPPTFLASPTEGAWSRCGGLLFLVPLLTHLELASFLAQHPPYAACAFPLHLLHDLAARLGAPPDDPLLLALGAPPAALPTTSFIEPAAFARVAGPPPRALLDAPPRAALPPAQRALAAFRSAARRFVRRRANTGLASMILRPARVHFTRTHLDLTLDLRRVHLGLRRAGLDLDPGYVPWLGRVIHLHYRPGEEPSHA